MIDTNAAPGDYELYFDRAPTYGVDDGLWDRFWAIQAEDCVDAFCLWPDGENCQCMAKAKAPRCYRDRDARAKLVETTNKLRAGLGWQPWEPGL